MLSTSNKLNQNAVSLASFREIFNLINKSCFPKFSFASMKFAPIDDDDRII